ncbi:MAG: CRTAC1 family protein [Phycisphaerales bacterium]
MGMRSGGWLWLALVWVLAPGVGAQTLSFTEVAAQAGANVPYLHASGSPSVLGEMSGGLAVGDFNMDGWPDLFAPGGGLAPDHLLINQHDGTFHDEAAAWGIVGPHRGAGCAVGDVDRNGYPDLFVVSYGPVGEGLSAFASRLYLNNGPDTEGLCSFREVAQTAGVNRVAAVTDGTGACFGDYDLDGDLDLFVCAWINTAGGNKLFRNDGVGPDGVPRFVDATSASGLHTDNLRGFTPRFVDMTGDRYPELLLTDDFGTSRYFESNGLDAQGVVTFTDKTAQAGIVFDCNGMGAAVGDVDGDGDLDWFMTNIYYPPPSDSCGNTLYVNDGGYPVTFTEMARETGVLDVGWGWGAVMGDVDNDGDLDIAATGGYFNYPPRPADLYLNRSELGAGLDFDEVAAQTGFNFTGFGRALVTLDYDRDGDLDLAMVNNGSTMRLYRNNLNGGGGGANSLTLLLETRHNPCLAPQGFGTRVVVRVGARVMVRVVDGGGSYEGQSDLRVHIGLGGATVAGEVELHWADGSVTRLTDVAAGEVEVVAYHEADLDHSGGLDYLDVYRFLALFALGDLGADLDGSGALDILDAMRLLEAFARGCG